MAVSLAGKVALVTGELGMRATCSMAIIEPVCLHEQIMAELPAGSTQGIGFGMIRGLAAAGADVVMHGLVEEKELKDKTAALAKEFDVRVGHSSANVRKPQEIRHAGMHKKCTAYLPHEWQTHLRWQPHACSLMCAPPAAGTCSRRLKMTWDAESPSSATM